MKKLFLSIVSLLAVVASASAQGYVPSEENIKSREVFADDRFGIFIHWGMPSCINEEKKPSMLG